MYFMQNLLQYTSKSGFHLSGFAKVLERCLYHLLYLIYVSIDTTRTVPSTYYLVVYHFGKLCVPTYVGVIS